MRTISGGITTHLSGLGLTLCGMLLLDLRDGTRIGLTDHDTDLIINLGDGAVTYGAGSGILPSDVTLAAGIETDNCEVQGPIGETVTLAALMGGRFGRAQARFFMVNWASLADGPRPILKGYVSEARIEGGRFVFQIRSDVDRLNQTVGRLITPYCEADHDACCINIADETATTIAGVTDEQTITVAAAITAADFLNGKLWFTSGGLTGTQPVEIFAVSGSTITLFAQLPDLPEIGDALILKEGCDRTRTMCRDRFDNAVNFRGFPEVPGSDQALKMPVPGAGGT